MLIGVLAVVGTCRASGPQTLTPEFFAKPPDPREQIAGRELSLKTRFSRTLLYLHLSGSFTDTHRQLFEAYLDRQRPSAPDTNARYEWQNLAAEAGGSRDYVETYKYLSRNAAGFVESRYIENCQNDAFITAVGTLRDRLQRYGRDSTQFSRWLEAQQQVFRNCAASEPSIPTPPDRDWSPLERQDREYQIAASLFYAMDYERSAERFRAIAADSTSPWSDLARYLVARSLVRNAETRPNDRLENLRSALDLYRDMASDADYAARFPSVRGFIRYLEIKLDTLSFMRAAATSLQMRPANIDSAELDDFLFLTQYGRYDSQVDGAGEAPLLRWHRLVSLSETTTAALAEITNEWRVTRNVAWLYLALTRATPANDPSMIEALAGDLDALEPSTQGYTDMRVALAELLASTTQTARAQAMARSLLDDRDLGLQTEQRNRLVYLLASLNSDPIESLRLAQLVPVAMSAGDIGFMQLDAAQLRQASRGGTLFTDETVEKLNRDYTPAQLLDAVDAIDFNDYLRERLVITAWVRALMLNDTPSARRAAEKLEAEFPALRPELEQFLAGQDSDFVAARILLLHPGFSPLVPAGIGRYGYGSAPFQTLFVSTRVALGLRNYNWWCEAPPEYPGVARFFGPQVLEYAAAHEDDARIPETLHRLVFATRYACDSGPGDISRHAFELLHRRYPDSEWTRATPYWYD